MFLQLAYSFLVVRRDFSHAGGGGGGGGLLQVEAFPVGTVGGSLVSAALLQANSLPRRPS